MGSMNMSKELKKDWLPKLQERYARRQRNGRRSHDFIHLLRMARAHDRARDGRMAQCPGNSHHPWGTAVAFAQITQAFHQGQIGRRVRLIEIRMAFAPILCRGENRIMATMSKAETSSRFPSAVVKSAMTLVSVAAALFATKVLQHHLSSEPFASLFFCAIMFSAWFGGYRQGLLAC